MYSILISNQVNSGGYTGRGDREIIPSPFDSDFFNTLIVISNLDTYLMSFCL